MLLKLKRRIKLERIIRLLPQYVIDSWGERTSANGTKGGPDAMSTALVPGRILLVGPSSSFGVSGSSGDDALGFCRRGEVTLDAALIRGDRSPI